MLLALRQCAGSCAAAFGTIDVLVNNAANDTRHTIEEVTPEYWDSGIAVNLKHQFFLTQAVIPTMKKAGRGSIINMSSISWVIPSVGLPDLCRGESSDRGTDKNTSARTWPA